MIAAGVLTGVPFDWWAFAGPRMHHAAFFSEWTNRCKLLVGIALRHFSASSFMQAMHQVVHVRVTGQFKKAVVNICGFLDSLEWALVTA